MCGIAGLFGVVASEQTIQECNQSLLHRGPDAGGVFRHEDTCLIHRRLSIIDLTASANQPLYSHGGEWVIVFNGEIYNYKELRQELIQEGFLFSTSSDTEVVLNMYIRYGREAVKRFIGMFAFSIYNTVTRRLAIFRDRVGVKPLYYSVKNNILSFASELRCIRILRPEAVDINVESLQQYLNFGYISRDNSILNTVSKLPPGCCLEWDHVSKEMTVYRYWSLEDQLCEDTGKLSYGEAKEKLEELLISSVSYRMVSDVPVGVFLSGGVDSSLVTALLQKRFGNIRTFTIGFDEKKYDEAGYAKKVADYLQTDHYEKYLSVEDARGTLSEFFLMYDEPFADSSGIPTSIISKFAKQNGCKVVLSADGGDELFGGYDRYISAARLYRRMNTLPYQQIGYIANISSRLFNSPLIASYRNLNNKISKFGSRSLNARKDFLSFYESFLSVFSSSSIERITGMPLRPALCPLEDDGNVEEKMMRWDFQHYLPNDLLVKIDRATMFNNIEGREPLLDHRLIEFAFSLPSSFKIDEKGGKKIAREILYKHLPREYFERPKMGFSIPLFKWFGRQMEEEFQWAFSKEVLLGVPSIDYQEVLNHYKVYLKFRKAGKEYNLLAIWHLYCYIKWYYAHCNLS